ncbi:E3 ubiquitin-protein ligase RNF220 isoform X4 [Calonectris borealis]|uniref:E3 ubiquitin-protein ligase RNF220 isoform X4 n=1 Tax=Calonectris borealis TaxID=1323832 RepID=UPI003F4B7DC5
MTLWTSRTRTATALKSTNGAGRRGYGLLLSWREDFESSASVFQEHCCLCRVPKFFRNYLELVLRRTAPRPAQAKLCTQCWRVAGTLGSGFIMCSGKENPDSDADLDVDGDDTLEYGKPQYTEADVIPCTGEEPGEAKEREALRGAVLNGGTPSTRITPEFSKWASDEMPSTSNGESSKQETMQKTCKNSDIEKITEDSAVTTFEALKARVRELERQLSRGDRYKCLICMDSYTMPLTSIQCWHVHCEECWLRTLGAKKLCPQCNTITSPGDLRRIYL